MLELDRGNTIMFRYRGYHTDPIPYVFIFDVGDNYIAGLNLHYLPLLRIRIDPRDRGVLRNPKIWTKTYNLFVRMGYFGTLIDDLNRKPNNPRNKTAWQLFYKRIKQRHPWAVKAYRRYLIDKMRSVAGKTRMAIDIDG